MIANATDKGDKDVSGKEAKPWSQGNLNYVPSRKMRTIQEMAKGALLKQGTRCGMREFE